MALDLFPLPKPLAADLPRLREQPLPHPILDRALARADVLRERREILKRWRVGKGHRCPEACLWAVAPWISATAGNV